MLIAVVIVSAVVAFVADGDMMKKSYKVALSGVMAALAIILMLITSVIPFGTFALPMLSGVLLISIVIELGCSWAFVVYAVTGVMSLLFVSDKEAVVYYIAFLGFYPIIKSYIERISGKVLQYIVKYLVFNICIISAFFISVFVFSVPKESFTIFSVYLPWVFLIIGNIVFLVYDYFVSKMVTLYLFKLHKLVSNKTKL